MEQNRELIDSWSHWWSNKLSDWIRRGERVSQNKIIKGILSFDLVARYTDRLVLIGFIEAASVLQSLVSWFLWGVNTGGQ